MYILGTLPESSHQLGQSCHNQSDEKGKVPEKHLISLFAEYLLISECVALYSYAGEAGDLSFTEGDVIKVHKDDGEWWEGSCKGEQGLFPANYVKKKDIIEVWYDLKCSSAFNKTSRPARGLAGTVL